MAFRFQNLALICLLGFLIRSEAACPTFFVELAAFPGTCYYFSQQIPASATWADARIFCQTFVDTDLLIIDTYDEFTAIDDHMRLTGYTSAYIGLSQVPINPEQWTWADGTAFPLESPLWDCSFPKLDTLTDCAVLTDKTEAIQGTSSSDRFRIQDTPCDSVLFYICEGPTI